MQGQCFGICQSISTYGHCLPDLLFTGINVRQKIRYREAHAPCPSKVPHKVPLPFDSSDFLMTGYLICVINTCGTRCLCAVSCQSRLTAAHDTASATGHDFYQMVFLLFALYLFHDFACIRQSAGHADLLFHPFITESRSSDKAFVSTRVLRSPDNCPCCDPGPDDESRPP